MGKKAASQKQKGKERKKVTPKTWLCEVCDFVHPAWHDNCSTCGDEKSTILSKQGQKKKQDNATVPASAGNVKSPPASVTSSPASSPGQQPKKDETKAAPSPAAPDANTSSSQNVEAAQYDPQSKANAEYNYHM